MDINTVCTLLIDALKGAGYNDSRNCHEINQSFGLMI